MFDSVWYIQVWFGRFGKVGLVRFVWFGSVNEDNFKRFLLPLKVPIASLELNLGTILVRVGSGRVGSVRSNSDYKAMLSPAGTGAWQKNYLAKVVRNTQ